MHNAIYIVVVHWTQVDSSTEDQYIGPFPHPKDAEEWGIQVIGSPAGTPWSVEEIDSPTSCVKQFQTEGF